MSKKIRDDAKYFAIFRSAFIIFLKENWFLILKRTSLPFEKSTPCRKNNKKILYFPNGCISKKAGTGTPP